MVNIVIVARGGVVNAVRRSCRVHHDLNNLQGAVVTLDIRQRNLPGVTALRSSTDEAFYIAVVDGARINRVGIEAADSDIMKTVYLPEVSYDYAADMDGDGVFDGDIADTADHRYGSSGIDGVAFGPAFGRTDGPQYLTVGYGVYSNLERTDNDHQVLLQYDVSNWERYARPLVESAPHRSGPSDLAGKYFVYTGNTRYGVQNIAYDADMERWFMGVYQGEKPQFPNYQLFAVEAATRPVMSDLVGVPSPAGAARGRDHRRVATAGFLVCDWCRAGVRAA